MDTGTPQMLPRDPVESMPNTQYKEIKQTRYRVHGKSVVYSHCTGSSSSCRSDPSLCVFIAHQRHAWKGPLTL